MDFFSVPYLEAWSMAQSRDIIRRSVHGRWLKRIFLYILPSPSPLLFPLRVTSQEELRGVSNPLFIYDSNRERERAVVLNITLSLENRIVMSAQRRSWGKIFFSYILPQKLAFETNYFLRFRIWAIFFQPHNVPHRWNFFYNSSEIHYLRKLNVLLKLEKL